MIEPVTEYAPTWRRITRETRPPIGRKALFKTDHGQPVIGTWYEDSCWTWWCPLPKHSAEDKALINSN